MENKEKMKIAVAAACLAATITVIVAALYRKPRKNKQHLTESDSSSCYLKTKHKPQHSFKRVLADNSYSPFRHLNLNSSSQTTGTIYMYTSLLFMLCYVLLCLIFACF